MKRQAPVRIFYEGFHYEIRHGKVFACRGQLMNEPCPANAKFTALVLDKPWADLIKAAAKEKGTKRG